MQSIMDNSVNFVRRLMRLVAKMINSLSRGHISPNFITFSALFAHFFIAWLLATGHPLWSGLLLIIFGLFDTLDGELARLQNKASNRGMFLDSMTDRVKEILIYVGIIYFSPGWFVYSGYSYPEFFFDWFGVIAVSALGISLLVSYSNAWGEAVLAKSTVKSKHETNKSFRLGMGYDIRMLFIIIGLISGRLPYFLLAIVVLGLVTVVFRSKNVIKKIS